MNHPEFFERPLQIIAASLTGKSFLSPPAAKQHLKENNYFHHLRKQHLKEKQSLSPPVKVVIFPYSPAAGGDSA
jgi:hypothetical protein